MQKTYEVTTNSNVEDDGQGLAGKGLPDSLVADGRALDLVELNALLVPGDGLLLPVAAAEVELAISKSVLIILPVIAARGKHTLSTQAKKQYQ